MNIHEYFLKYSTAAIAVTAKRAGTSLPYLQHCKYGFRRMSADLAIRLEHITNGELTARDLRPDLPWPPWQPPNSPPA